MLEYDGNEMDHNQFTFATSSRLVFESGVRFRLKCTDTQYDMMASSHKPNADKVNARYKYACQLKELWLIY